MDDIAPVDAGDLSVQALGPDAGKAPERPRISSPEEAAKLAPGTTFIGPDDKERVVPYKVDRPEQIANLPDGADFMGPDGKLRQKPRYEGIDFTAQTLYDMSVNDKERRKALERSYPGKVRDDPAGGFYIDDDGVPRKPGRGLQKIPAALASGAAPTILSVLGALGGGAVGGTGGAAAGSVVPVAGTVAGALSGGTAGAAAGGAGGAVLGQSFNDLILGLSGVYDRTKGEELTELGLAGLGGMAGAGVGRGISTVVPSLKTGISALTSAAPGIARTIAGVKTAEQKANLTMGRELAEKGVLVPPSSVYPELPHVANIVEVFDPAFHTNQPLLESATAHYEKSAGEVLKALGVKDPGSLTKPLSDVSPKKFGEAVKQRAVDELSEADARLQAALDAKKASILKTGLENMDDDSFGKISSVAADTHFGQTHARLMLTPDEIKIARAHGIQIEDNGVLKNEEMQRLLDERDRRIAAGAPRRNNVLKEAKEAAEAAQKVINAGYEDIEQDIKTGMKVAGAGADASDLWSAVGQKFITLRKAVGARATQMYDAADQAAGGHLPNIEGLPEQASQFLEGLPGDFQAKYPDIVKKMRDLAGVPNPPKGAPGHIENGSEWIKEPVNPTFGQLHNLRSQLRSNIHYSDLTPDQREGAYKFFQNKVDAILHDTEAVPELQEASKLLKDADKFYADNIKLFNAQQVKAVMRGLESGEPADPQNLYNVVVKSGQTELTKAIKEKVGPNLWAGVAAADKQKMFDASKTLTPGVVDGRIFAREILERHRQGTLEVVHGKEASEKLLEQARRIEMLSGREPIPVRPNDTITQIMARARQAEEVAKVEAKRNPLAAFNKAMKEVHADHQRAKSLAARERRKDPLAFLYDPTVHAVEAGQKILDNENLVIATAAKFGQNSPEFEMLRQLWAQRFLTGSLRVDKKFAGLSPDMQQLMFPGVTLNQMQTLAREMPFLLQNIGRGGAGSSMSAFAKVEHPASRAALVAGGAYLGGPVGAMAGAAVPPLARIALGNYYAFVRKMATNPALMRWLEKGLNGSPADREVVRQSIAAVLQKGGAVGAGAGEAAFQGSGPE